MDAAFILKQPRVHIKWLIITDIAGSMATWLLFYFLRTEIYDYDFSVPPGFYVGAALYTAGWLSLHLLSGAYEDLYHKTAITETFRTFLVSLIGCLTLLFFFILKNPHTDNTRYYSEFYCLLIPILLVTLINRMAFLFLCKKQLSKGSVFFNVLLVGSGKNASSFYKSFQQSNQGTGYFINSFLNTNGNNGIHLPGSISKYNDLTRLDNIIAKHHVEEVIITVEKNERNLLTRILQQLSDTDVNIKIMPDAVDIITGAVQTSNVMGAPLIDVHSGLLPSWQRNIKRLIDIVISLISLVILLPVLIYTAIKTKLSSPGSIFYLQERIGYKGKPFTIYKFRSMKADAESKGPLLSSDDDPRIIPWGKVMRKWRLDELPQLINILKGEMSLVGPRPERKFYVDQIIEQQPEFKYLFKVKPGLSSWGMVKFGYASSVDEMIQRMQYDLMYVENISLLLDIRIMILTLITLLKGTGK